MAVKLDSGSRRNKRNSRRGWLLWTRDLILIGVALTLFSWWQTRDTTRGLAPDLVGQLLSGQLVEIEEYRGKPLLVHFWAVWCPVCAFENNTIDELADDYPVLTIATSSGDARKVGVFLERERLSFPVILDQSGEIAREWGVTGVPVSFILDADGNIVHVASGYTTQIGLRARLWLAGS